jgi:RNA-directed DNA polymerase
MPCDEDCRTAVLGKTERTVGWEGDGEPTMNELLRHCMRGKPAAPARLALPSLSHSFTLDSVLLFEYEEDAQRVLAVIAQRFERFGLTLHPEKTRLVAFQQPTTRSRGPRPQTFDLLGFTHYWGRSLQGRWVVKRRTAKDRLRRSLKAISLWCRRHRHLPVREQQDALNLKLRGHYAYYGILGNVSSLVRFRFWVTRIWRKWLSRRSQKAWISWERFTRLLRTYTLLPARRPRAA